MSVRNAVETMVTDKVKTPLSCSASITDFRTFDNPSACRELIQACTSSQSAVEGKEQVNPRETPCSSHPVNDCGIAT